MLVAGGYNNISGSLASAELYDPAIGTWTATGALNTGRQGHTAKLLLNGKVLIAGGYNYTSGHPTNAELYNPVTGTWSLAGSLNVPRTIHSMTLLPNGKVLVAGGADANNSRVSSAELYDSVAGTWTATGSLVIPRGQHTATLLPNGQVLVTGGSGGTYLSSAELYDPGARTWKLTGVLNTPRSYHTASLLPNGKVLVAGGYRNGVLTNAELYDTGLGFSYSWQPQITAVNSPLNLGSSLVVTGSQFRAISGASGGNTQDSSSDYPLVQLRSLDSERTVFLLSTNWSTNSFASVPVWGFPPGYALATVFVNGIPSTSSVVNVSVPVPTPPTLTDTKKITNGSFQFAFTNSVGALFGVLTTTNVAQPLSNWVALGGVTEVSPGRFQFTDPQATNAGLRFYRARSP